MSNTDFSFHSLGQGLRAILAENRYDLSDEHRELLIQCAEAFEQGDQTPQNPNGMSPSEKAGWIEVMIRLVFKFGLDIDLPEF